MPQRHEAARGRSASAQAGSVPGSHYSLTSGPTRRRVAIQQRHAARAGGASALWRDIGPDRYPHLLDPPSRLL